ncbi:hypothetical protein [Streptomyces ardesiacus]|uniref:hypothetical protein n=1 Tax=Streptomyces ardesiacus TaxID=285564 RepID=UPI0006E1A89C|nr:hypothetical protein [Streptomyces sp. NBRC 110030]
MRFLEESGERSKAYDFSTFELAPELQQWMARCFSRRISTSRTPAKRLRTANGGFDCLRGFARILARHQPPPTCVEQLAEEHVRAFAEHYDDRPKRQHSAFKQLRTVLRNDPELPEEARQALFNIRVKQPEVERPGAYREGDWQAIMTAARRDIRLGRERIDAGRRLMARWRSGDPQLSKEEAELGSLLDTFDRTGDLPRWRTGDCTAAVLKAGGFREIAGWLCLTKSEATAFCLLLTALTQENFGTVANWPAAHFHPEGDQEDPRVLLVEESKPRRGPEREHMITALEHLPDGVADLLAAEADEPRLMRSPLRLYLLLLSLTELPRRHGGSSAAFALLNLNSGRSGRWCVGVRASDVLRWARSHGFPAAQHATPGRPEVDTGRIRQTALERRQHPVAHSRRTHNDVYLKGSSTVQADSRRVVGAALRQEVAKARVVQSVPVFTADFVAWARENPAEAAAQTGLEPRALKDLLDAQRDTPAVACVDHLASPVAEPGQPCTASFLQCLTCENARALPHHLPVQLAVRDGILQRRPHLDPPVWQARFHASLQQLEEIIDHFTEAEHRQARDDLTSDQRRLVDDLLDGRWDLR